MTRYCYTCGGPLTHRQPEFDHQIREVCEACGWINYQNPKVQVAVVAVNQDRILWMRRADEPRRGYWGLPGGFMELDESPREAAAREAFEETGLVVDPQAMSLYAVGNIRSVNEVHLLFTVESDTDVVSPGPEALEACWFDEQGAPWGQLAYPVVADGLRKFYRDIRENNFGLYYAEHQSEPVDEVLYLRNHLRPS